MALTKVSRIEIMPWTAVLQGAKSESAVINCATYYKTTLWICGFIDTTDTTAHTGTEFIVESNPNPVPPSGSDDEYWSKEGVPFVELIGTMNPEANVLVTDPAPAGTTTFTVASTTGYVVNDVTMPYIAIQDPTLANSELAYLSSIVTNTSITILNGTTRAHAKTTTLFGNVAFKKKLTFETTDISRMRLVVNNSYDSNGAKINYKLSITGCSKY